MDITIIAVGKKMPDWINEGIREYTKRLSGEVRISLIEVVAERRSKTVSVEKTLLREANKIRAALPAGSRYIALDETGKQLSTEGLSIKLNSWIAGGQSRCLVIGGADGLHASIKTGATEIWSLSKLTLPHALARVLLVEQIYRAWTILKKHPYHRK
jgi:23S rRNA (pseudouridine1915-N3)-methyltransferase